MTGLLIIGAGGHGKVVADAALETGRWQRIAFLDDAYVNGGSVLGLPVLGGVSKTRELVGDYPDCLVAIGNNARRRTLLQSAEQAGFALPALIHPRAQVSQWAVVGPGSVVMAGAVVQVDSRLGFGVIVNTAASVDHDCVIGDAVHVCPGVHLGGTVTVGDGVWIGIGATVREGMRIGAGAVIGAGACVIDDIPARAVAVGVPARVREA